MWTTDGQTEAIRIAEHELSKEESFLFLKALNAHFNNLLTTSKRQVREFFHGVWREAKANERNDRLILQEDY